MNLHEYFNQQKKEGLSELEKINIYQTILHKHMQKSFQRKRSFLHIKSFVYTSFLLFFIVGFYGIYFFQQSTEEDREGYMLSRLADTNVVQADFVAKIVDFNGAFSIEQAGKVIQTSNIKDGDIVSLQKNTQLVFHIDNDTKAKIIGPAKFVINKKTIGTYKIALLQGEYVEMSSLQKESKNKIELAMDNFVVSQSESKKRIDYQLIKQGENHILKNNGAKLLITSDEKNQTTSIGNKQVLAMQGNDISLFDDFEKFTKAVKNKNLSQTFTFNDSQIINETRSGEQKDSEIKVLNPEEILSINDKDIPELDLGLNVGEQNIATPEQIKIIDSQLYTEFVKEILNNLVLAYEKGDKEQFDYAFDNIEKRVFTVAKSFNYEYRSIGSTEQEKIQSMIQGIQKLVDFINEYYLLPPKYVENLKSIIPILTPISKIPYRFDKMVE